MLGAVCQVIFHKFLPFRRENTHKSNWWGTASWLSCKIISILVITSLECHTKHSQWAASLAELEVKCSSIEKQLNIFRCEASYWYIVLFRKFHWLFSDWQSRTVGYSGVKRMQAQSPWLLKWLPHASFPPSSPDRFSLVHIRTLVLGFLLPKVAGGTNRTVPFPILLFCSSLFSNKPFSFL